MSTWGGNPVIFVDPLGLCQIGPNGNIARCPGSDQEDECEGGDEGEDPPPPPPVEVDDRGLLRLLFDWALTGQSNPSPEVRDAAIGGFKEGARDAAGGELNALSFGLADGTSFGANPNSSAYRQGQIGGTISRDIALTAVGLRAASALGGTRVGHVLNHNRYVRIGPGNIPKGRPLTYGPGQRVPTLRIGNGKPSPLNHFDLRVLGH